MIATMKQSLDSPVRHRRRLTTFFAAALRVENYQAVVRAFAVCTQPIDFLKRYVTNRGNYPHTVGLRTPTGRIDATVYAGDDIQTINEIFLRGDYDVIPKPTVVVDFGSNIGISALYFLTRDRDCFVYCYEPLPQNTERFELNLQKFSERVQLSKTAVGEGNGKVRFGWEPTGRYGGIGRETGSFIDVDCIDSNDALRAVLARHDEIDILKVDVETLEKFIIERIPAELRMKIKVVVAEYRFAENSLSGTHFWSQRNNIGKFIRA